jgi:4-carboxymuconolactone decarboxylase
MMVEYLPDVYTDFRERYPQIADALDRLGQAGDDVFPLDEQAARLVKLGLAIGAQAQGAVRSNARKALDAGLDPDVIRAVAGLAVSTCGFPAAIAAYKWIDEVLAREA